MTETDFDTLEITGEIKLMISEISPLNLQVCMGNCFRCYFRELIIFDFSFKQPAKRTLIYFKKSFWYKVFVHEKLKLLDFLSDFVLISNDEIQLYWQFKF